MLVRRATAEFIGTALLLIAVIGSGIAAQSLSPNDSGRVLLPIRTCTHHEEHPRGGGDR